MDDNVRAPRFALVGDYLEDHGLKQIEWLVSIFRLEFDRAYMFEATLLVWKGGLDSRIDLHAQIGTMADQIYRDVILEQHVCLFWGTMSTEFVFTYGNTRPHRASNVNGYLQSEDISRMDWLAFSLDLNPIEHV
ncbi:transposable element Tcb1 transposase [Trichonephila clavipes]|uniref:Transposable element Tcb1 transposase n=1 Tax=Trichonephila clavipes TaxID=2585209 RepID=A0A8X6VLP6_TRICX|nr:transposable element Tcb1 transposase [Trichonephila clavipes]